MSEQARSRRRTNAEVRALILEAARALFAESGYANTTTRAIAKRAEASEVLLYRYFNSKAELFEEAISEPFDRIMDEFSRRWTHGAKRTRTLDYAREYSRNLYEMLLQDRGLILALITNRAYESGGVSNGDRPRGLRRYFDNAAEGLSQFYDEHDLDPGVPPELGGRLAFSSVVAAALLDDWVFENVGDRAHIGQAVAEYIARGLYGDPLEGATPTRSVKRKRRRPPSRSWRYQRGRTK